MDAIMDAANACGRMKAFRDRLQKAAEHAKVHWGQSAVAKSLGVSRQTVDRWFSGGEPKGPQYFAIAEKWGVSARFLATGEGEVAAPGDFERLAANPREEMMLLLFRGLTREQQRELAIEANAMVDANREIQTRFLNTPIRTVSNESVEAAFGKTPSPRKRAGKKDAKDKRHPGDAMGDYLEED